MSSLQALPSHGRKGFCALALKTGTKAPRSPLKSQCWLGAAGSHPVPGRWGLTRLTAQVLQLGPALRRFSLPCHLTSLLPPAGSCASQCIALPRPLILPAAAPISPSVSGCHLLEQTLGNHLKSSKKTFWKLLPTGNRQRYGAAGIPAGGVAGSRVPGEQSGWFWHGCSPDGIRSLKEPLWPPQPTELQGAPWCSLLD